jgi:hypothetical protein
MAISRQRSASSDKPQKIKGFKKGCSADSYMLIADCYHRKVTSKHEDFQGFCFLADTMDNIFCISKGKNFL